MQFQLGPSDLGFSDGPVSTSPSTIDSREIANISGKRHADVCRDIVTMLESLQLPERNFASGYLDAQNQRRKCFLLPKRESLILASGYSVDLRAKIIDRWMELESSVPAPRNMVEALTLALEQAKVIEQQKQQLAIAAPKVAAQTLLEGAGGLFGVREAGKQLGIGQKAFVAMLLSKKIMYRLGGDLVPYQTMIDRGFFQTTTGTSVHGDDVHAWKQAKFTAKGIAWIAEKVASVP